jgi:hypothetical protein
MRCKRFVTRIAGAGALVGAALVLVSGALAAGNYTDPTGDSNGAPDITNVVVSSDSSGRIAITVALDNLPSTGPLRTFVFLDTDMNQSTGAPDTGGADYVLVDDRTDNTFDFAAWNDNAWDDSIPYSTVTDRTTANSVSFSVNRSELGNTSEFNFWVRTRAGDLTAAQFDTGPDYAVWNFSLQVQGPELVGALYEQTPTAGPAHAKTFTVKPIGVKVTASAQGPLVPPPDAYSCRATLAGKAIAASGLGGCTWRLPKNAKGKTFVVFLTVTYEGASLTIRQAYNVA